MEDTNENAVDGTSGGTRTETGQKPDRNQTRRTLEERAALARAKAARTAARVARAAEKARRKAAREARRERIAAGARDIAQSFQRRADRIAQYRPGPGTASSRKKLRKLLHAAAEADVKNEVEMERVAAADGEVRDRGTGLTRLKLSTPPVGKLIEEKKIGADERSAADEIYRAISMISAGVAVRGMAFERVDKSRTESEVGTRKVSAMVHRYTVWAAHWTARANLYCDPILEIVVAAVVDERPIRVIAADMGYHRTKIEKGVVCGLRDYAARAGLVHGHVAKQWMEAAESLFVPTNGLLLDAIRRARIEA